MLRNTSDPLEATEICLQCGTFFTFQDMKLCRECGDAWLCPVCWEKNHGQCYICVALAIPKD